ncbi:MAG: alkaline phosphatase family protein [Myxococcota bacterium]|nr:alkaline phosphatase family protein [Myxococcota bacterium]
MRFLSACLLSLSLLASSPATAEPLRDRLVIIGIDGLTFEVVDPLVAQGKLPTFQKLMDSGSRAILMSEKPMRSPALWTTIATGQPRATHRIFDFVTGSWYWPKAERHKKQRLVTSDMRASPAIWNMASEASKKSVVVGWLNTWPAEEVNGVMIAPYVALGRKKQTSIKGKIYQDAKRQTWPTRLHREITPLIRSAESVTDAEVAQIVEEPPKKSILYRKVPKLDRYLYTVRWSIASALTNTALVENQLQENPNTDLVMTYFDGTDTLAHRFWLMRQPLKEIRKRLKNQGLDPKIAGKLKRHFAGVVDAYYVFIDQMLARLVKAAGPSANILIVSDHGWGDLQRDRVIHPTVPFDGRHTLEGALIASGPAFGRGTLKAKTIYDVVPTSLYAMGIPVPSNLPGEVPFDLFTPKFKELYPHLVVAKTNASTTKAGRNEPSAEPSHFEETEVERLRSLGYVQ